MKNENFLAYFMRILISWVVYKFQTVNPGWPPSQPLVFWSTAIRRDIRAALYFFNCELCCRIALSVFYSPVLTRPRIFWQLWTALS